MGKGKVEQPTLEGLEVVNIVPKPMEQRVRMSCTAIIRDSDWFTLSVGLWVAGGVFQHLTDPESPLLVARHGEGADVVREQAHDVMKTILVQEGIMIRDDATRHYETRHLDGDRVQEWRYWVYLGARRGIFIQEDSSGKAVIRPIV